MSVISLQTIEQAYTYKAYRNLIDNLMAEGKTTGPNQSPNMIDYTKLNIVRMNRLDKTVKLSEPLLEIISQIPTHWTWLVITEAWCGDAAQNIPIMAAIEQASQGRITLKLILRDENLEVIDAYLTNGARSIPKLVCLQTEDLEELGTWGPRPAPVQEMVMDFKVNGDGDYQQFAAKVQKWYAEDKTRTLQEELLDCLAQWVEQSTVPKS